MTYKEGMARFRKLIALADKLEPVIRLDTELHYCTGVKGNRCHMYVSFSLPDVGEQTAYFVKGNIGYIGICESSTKVIDGIIEWLDGLSQVNADIASAEVHRVYDEWQDFKNRRNQERSK